MFIKFSDKTKNIMVKKSKKQAYRDGYVEENSIYLDSDDEKDRRVKALSEEEDSDADGDNSSSN